MRRARGGGADRRGGPGRSGEPAPPASRLPGPGGRHGDEPARRHHATAQFLTSPAAGRLTSVTGLPRPGPDPPLVRLRARPATRSGPPTPTPDGSAASSSSAPTPAPPRPASPNCSTTSTSTSNRSPPDRTGKGAPPGPGWRPFPVSVVRSGRRVPRRPPRRSPRLRLRCRAGDSPDAARRGGAPRTCAAAT